MPSITDAEKEIGRLTLALAEAEKKAERDYLRFVEADREEIERLREENARLREAVGLMTTMAPFMELDVNDPVGTAKTVWAEQEKLFQENARLREALKPFVPKTQVIDAAIPDTRPIDVMVRAGELRAAAAALKETGDE